VVASCLVIVSSKAVAALVRHANSLIPSRASDEFPNLPVADRARSCSTDRMGARQFCFYLLFEAGFVLLIVSDHCRCYVGFS
jgi:hypothetical protein